MTWLATAEGLTVHLSYAEVSARIQATPSSERERLPCGGYRLGAWTLRRLS
jgi:hypothetical protein